MNETTKKDIIRGALRTHAPENLAGNDSAVYLALHMHQDGYRELFEELTAQPHKSEWVDLCDAVQQLAQSILIMIDQKTGCA